MKGDLNTLLTSKDRSSRQKSNEATEILSGMIEKLNLFDMHGILLMHQKNKLRKNPEYTFFSSIHGTFSRIDHILGHKTSLHRFKRLEIISNIQIFRAF